MPETEWQKKRDGTMSNERKKIIDILMNELSSVYCFNCVDDLDDDLCRDCHRNYMNWRLSESAAEEITDKILEVIKDG